MIALLSSLLGFAASAIPKIFESFQDRRDKAQEVKLLQLQYEIDKQRLDSNLSASLVQSQSLANVAVQESYQEDIIANQALGNRWVIALSASVRPVVTYAFFLLYAVIKYAQWDLMVHPPLPWQDSLSMSQALVAIWNEEDMGLFCSIVAFWFGDRLWKKK